MRRASSALKCLLAPRAPPRCLLLLLPSGVHVGECLGGGSQVSSHSPEPDEVPTGRLGMARDL